MKEVRLIRKMTLQEVEVALALEAEERKDFVVLYGAEKGQVVELHRRRGYHSERVMLLLLSGLRYAGWLFEEIKYGKQQQRQ